VARRRTLERLVAVGALALATLAACRGVRVETRGELAPDPAQTLTWAWAEGSPAGALEPGLAQQIREQVTADLAARGLAEAQGGEPDLLLTSSVDVTRRIRVNDPYYFFPLVQQIEDGWLTLAFTDPRTGELRWEGTGRRELRAAARNADVLTTRLVPTTEERRWDVPGTVQAILAELPAAPSQQP